MTDRIRTVQVMIPEWLWGRIASSADVRGVKVGDVIADALLVAVHREGLRKPTNGELLAAELNAARASGWRAPQRGKPRV